MATCRNLQSELCEAENEELDSSSGCDMSFEFSSDNVLNSPPSHRPRRLVFSEQDATIDTTPLPGNKLTCSPPYRRVRALRLFDSPLTPKTILKKSSVCSTPVPRAWSTDKPRAVASAYPKIDKPAANVNPFTPDG